MTNNKIIKTFLLIVSSLFLLTACLPEAENLDQKNYMLAPEYPKPVAKANTGNLQIATTNIAPQFSDNQFVYRTSELTYTKDYYNIFFIPANQQINQFVYRAFQTATVFENVELPGSLLPANYLLRTNVTELYADYRDSNNPKAILTINATLYRNVDDNMTKIMQKTYHTDNKIEAKNSNGLVNAWSENLTEILASMVKDVNLAVQSTPKKNKEA